jgi:drug/metabolite transporter (DMT)-like permease
MKTGVLFAVFAAMLFGVGTPAAKLLLGHTTPVMLAGLLYAGSGVGLASWVMARQWFSRAQSMQAARWTAAEMGWLAAAILTGGIAGPILLMVGLAVTPAATASLLLNMEGVLTALLAWFVFKENFDRRILLGMACIVAGGAVLAWPGPAGLKVPWGALAIVGACLCWAVDNNLTRKVSAGDPVIIAALKGLVAGGVNLSIALSLGAHWPAWPDTLAAGVLGLGSYGLSFVFFVVALWHLGAARTGAYFSTAPFIGAGISLALFRQSPDTLFWVSAGLMAVGVWLHLSEKHSHLHAHERLRHTHSHRHDEHHQHVHDFKWDGREPHSHEHEHEPMTHSHAHYPDLHHRHRHR